MNPTTSVAEVRRQAWLAAGLGAAVCVVGAYRNAPQFFHSYLFAFEILCSLSLGCLGFLLLYLLVGGKWGKAVEPLLVQGAGMIRWMGLLVLPILLGLKHIYPWMNGIMTEGPSEGHQHLWFSLPFYIGRTVFYFGIWSFLANRATAYVGHAQERESPKAMRVGAIGIVLFFLTMTFAGVDWIMSLESRWSSSIYGGILLAGHALSALSFMVLMLNWLTKRAPERFRVSPEASHDLGNLMLAFTMFWTYQELSQYLIIWSGNLPEEVAWYLVRRSGGWISVTLGLFLLQFAFTFSLLLSRERKRSISSLAKVAALVLALRVVDNFWLIVPDFTAALKVHVLDGAALVAVAGAWFAIYLQGLEKEGVA